MPTDVSVARCVLVSLCLNRCAATAHRLQNKGDDVGNNKDDEVPLCTEE